MTLRPDTPSRWTVLGVPIDSVGAPDGGPPMGTELAPAALRDHGIVDRLGAHDAGDLEVRITGHERDPRSGLVGGGTVAPVVAEVRRATAALVRGGARPLLLGGCCTLLMGAFAGAAESHERLGLAYVDGHLDLYDERTSPTGEAADMPVGVLLGVGEPGLLAATGPAAALQAARLRVLGSRDPDEAADVAQLVERLGVRSTSPAAVARDPAGVAARTLDAVAGDGFWLHLDVDVLDEAAFPATDYLLPGGLDLDALRALLHPLARDTRLVGASVGCYNPAKDPTGEHGATLADLLVDVLGARP